MRRGDRGASSSAPLVAADIGGVAPHIGRGEAAKVVSFPGRPSDMSDLVSYNHHVALRLWEVEVRLCYKLLYSVCVYYVNFFISFVVFCLGSVSPKVSLPWEKSEQLWSSSC